MNLSILKEKLILGTVQLGLSYGINNHTGKPDKNEAFRILRKAQSENIRLLDSAEAYGDSLQIISSYFQEEGSQSFEVISKFIGDGAPLQNKIDKTLSELNTSSVYGYLYHRFSDYASGKYHRELLDLKDQGKIKKIGVSLYTMEELEKSIADKSLSVIQIPFNPFDASIKKLNLLSEARLQGKEIHVRSVFLQGLFFKHPAQLTGNLKDFSFPLQEFEHIANSYNLNMRQACLNFALHQANIDYVIIGVENVAQLDQNIDAIMEDMPAGFFKGLESLPVVDDFLRNPANWKP